MSEKKEKQDKIWWLWFGFGVTCAYAVLVVVFIRKYETGFVDRVVDLDLNELGDFLAGIFAPLAFLWLFVATMMQSQELKLQRKELTENREVMQEQADAAKAQAKFIEAQTAAMQRQTVLNEQQLAMTLRAGERAHRIAMFEKRIEIYNKLIAIGKEDFYNSYQFDQQVVDDMFDLSNRSEFMFDDEFNDWISDVAAKMYELKRDTDDYNWNHSRNKTGMTEGQLEGIAVKQREHNNRIPALREFVSSELMDSTIVDRFEKFLNLNDPDDETQEDEASVEDSGKEA